MYEEIHSAEQHACTRQFKAVSCMLVWVENKILTHVFVSSSCPKLYSCSVCGKESSSQSYMSRHRKKHILGRANTEERSSEGGSPASSNQELATEHSATASTSPSPTLEPANLMDGELAVNAAEQELPPLCFESSAPSLQSFTPAVEVLTIASLFVFMTQTDFDAMSDISNLIPLSLLFDSDVQLWQTTTFWTLFVEHFRQLDIVTYLKVLRGDAFYDESIGIAVKEVMRRADGRTLEYLVSAQQFNQAVQPLSTSDTLIPAYDIPSADFLGMPTERVGIPSNNSAYDAEISPGWLSEPISPELQAEWEQLQFNELERAF
jgi:hypothetical protein